MFVLVAIFGYDDDATSSLSFYTDRAVALKAFASLKHDVKEEDSSATLVLHFVSLDDIKIITESGSGCVFLLSAKTDAPLTRRAVRTFNNV